MTQNPPDPDQAPQGQSPESPKKRHPVRRFLKYFFGLILLAFLAAGGFSGWLLATQSGQNWLVSTLNGILESRDGGLGIKITGLSGTLPVDFSLGVELSDSQGVWLTAPRNHFALDWRSLPQVFSISALRLADVDIARLPSLPPSPPDDAPKSSFGIPEIQDLAAKTSDFLSAEHWWLPEVRIAGVEIANLLLPGDLLPHAEGSTPARPRVDMGFEAALAQGAGNAALSLDIGGNGGPLDAGSVQLEGLSAKLDLDIAAKTEASGLELGAAFNSQVRQPRLAVADLPPDLLGDSVNLGLKLKGSLHQGAEPAAWVSLDGPTLAAGPISLKAEGKWDSGKGWRQAEIDGPARYFLNLALQPVPALAEKFGITWSPLALSLNLNGDLPKASLDFYVACAALEAQGHSVKDVRASVRAPNLALPLDGNALSQLLNEQVIPVSFSAFVDEEKIDLRTVAFFQGLESGKSGELPSDWRAGLRTLLLKALGVTASGNLVAVLKKDADPALNGKFEMSVDDWQPLTKFLDGLSPSGDVKIALNLDNTGSGQDAALAVSSGKFAISGKEPMAQLANLALNAEVKDVFATRQIQASLNAGSISAAGLALDAKAEVSGQLTGPLVARVNTGGSVQSALEAEWRPGLVDLRGLSLEMDAPKPGGAARKPLRLGVKALQAAQVSYGEEGLGVRNLDIQITPSGRLRASGAISKDKLGIDLTLSRLEFKPWQALVPQIPEGSAEIQASLSGTPTRPGGRFNIDLRDVVVPGVPLAPVSVTVAGDITNAASGSGLNVHVNLDQKTLKALGSESAAISARVPLKFAGNGVPDVDMAGPLNAQVRWNGALGPIWNLLPVPDQRVNGRLDIDVTARGTLQKPIVRGNVGINKGRYENVALGVLLTDINLRLDLADRQGMQKISGPLDSLPGSVTLALGLSDGRGGSVKVNGSAGIDGNDLDIKATIDKLRPLRRRDVHIELSGDATVAGTALAPVVAGEIIVNQGEVLLNNLDFTGSVTTLDITSPNMGKAQAAAPAAKQDAGSGSLNVRINMLPRFTVEGRGLTSIWKASLLVQGTPQDPRITGNISCVRGTFDFLGKIFALTRGVVFFGGGSLSNPLLDIEMTNERPDLTAHILLKGPVDKMKLTLTSDPTLPRDEIISQVLFGKSVGDLSRYEALQLAAAVAQLAGFGAGGELLGFAKKALGVDVLRLGSTSDAGGEPGDQTAGGTTIEMGKYITDQIYMGVQQGFKEDSTAFIIQLELTPRTSLELRSEQNNTWGGIKWSINY